jgi:predicted PurR-regulated permease PerM
VIGPSVVVLALVAVELTQGGFLAAASFLITGLVLIGFLPDALIRPQIAQRTADLPASLYFVGFTGGILSLGAIGIIAGPVAVALLDEIVTLLGEEATSDPDKRHGD